jgi:hypothetical protein
MCPVPTAPTCSASATMTVMSSIFPPVSCFSCSRPCLKVAPTSFSHQGRSRLQGEHG